MDIWWHISFILLLLIIPLSHSQSNNYITQPTLTGVTAVNSTALTISWQFASSAFDQSNLIQIYINIFEFYYNYNATYLTNYTFTTNKTITSLTTNFQLVNAFYYVCFYSNSTITNVTAGLYYIQCQLATTCTRSNSSVCPQASFVTILPTTITSNSFIITVYWLNQLPYTQGTTIVQLLNENLNGTLVSTVTNSTYTSLSYSFSNQQPSTTYTINTIVTYTILNNPLTQVNNLTVTTSRSSNLISTSDIFIFGASIFCILLIKFF